MTKQDLQKDEVENAVPPNPAVSVYMLAYQHAEYVRQAVDSVLAQKTNFPFEICLGEDESSDGTREICVKLAKEHPEKIRLFLRSRNDVIQIAGRPTGRYNGNMTRNACRAPYVAICECDDFWIDEFKLQRQYDYLQANSSVSVCSTRGIERTLEGKQVDNIRPDRYLPTLDHDWFLSGKTGVLTASLMYRVGSVNQNLLCDPKVLTGDWALLLGATENGQRCDILDNITVVYRKNGKGSWTGIDSVAKLQAKKKTLERYLVHSQRTDLTLANRSIAIMTLKLERVEEQKNGKLAEALFLLKQLFSRNGRSFLKEIAATRKSRKRSQ